ncbi:MAG: acylneuraminate cytidylyltransferase family protein [Anaerolineales bacterium]
MSRTLTFAALVPMRHQSDRVPEKNYRQVAGRPLYEYILDTLLQVDEITEILIDTDSPVIASGVRQRYLSVRLIDRPQELSGGEIPMNRIIGYDLQFTKADLVLQTHSTNPLLLPETLRGAIRTFGEKYPTVDSLFSVTRVQRRFWTADGRPLNHDPAILLRTQDLPPIFEENSCFYIFPREGFLVNSNRIGPTPFLFEIAAEEAFDLDTMDDLRRIEALLSSRTAVEGE